MLCWLLLAAVVVLFQFLSGHSAAYISNTGSAVNLGAIICLSSLLLLPATRKLSDLVFNSLLVATTFILFLLLPVKTTLPYPMVLQGALAVFSLALLLHSLSNLLRKLRLTSKIATPAVLIIAGLTGSSVLWLGPAVELFVLGNGVIDSIVASNPLSYLSVAVEYDYLRNEWFYQHTPFGSLRFNYPSYSLLTASYLGLAIAIHGLPFFIKARNSTAANRLITTFNPQGDT